MRVAMVPLLPCTSIDEMAEFWVPLGTKISYRQVRPNPYLALEREGGFVLHYFALAGFVPEESYSTCVVLVDDPGELFDEWAAGLRTRYGKLPLTGLPRITRPRRRKNADYRTGFSLVDPAGNWIRVAGSGSGNTLPAGGALARALDNAVVLADSHGDVRQAHKILSGALARAGAEASEQERVDAEEFLRELDSRLEP